MKLPGGLFLDGKLSVDFAFKPVNGHVELALAEAAARYESLPAKVSGALSAAMERIGTYPVSHEIAACLSVADRQFLMRRLAAIQGLDEMWMTATCGGCKEPFDFFIRHSSLPVKRAGRGFPFIVAETSRGRLRFRAPTGADQEKMPFHADSGENGERTASRKLLAHCLMETEGSSENPDKVRQLIESLSEDDVEKIDQAMEAVFPEAATVIQSRCPQCRKENLVEIDPYFCLNHGPENIFEEIHILAKTYHWSEQEILSLPKTRRRRYLGLIDNE